MKFLDFKKSIPKHPNDLLYLDPPYKIKNKLYGNRGDLHKDFEHENTTRYSQEKREMDSLIQ